MNISIIKVGGKWMACYTHIDPKDNIYGWGFTEVGALEDLLKNTDE